VQDLPQIAARIRRNIITMIYQAGSGHPGGSLGIVDILVSLYFAELKHDPKKPDWLERDYMLFSAGHLCPAWYATLAEAGYFPETELSTLRKFNSRLAGHPEYNPLQHLPGIENPSGPLGQGLSHAIGLSLAHKLDQKNNHIFCLLSDGEQAEGQTMEALLYAGSHKLSNITAIIDQNGIQLSGDVKDILPQGDLARRIRLFGWQVMEVDGHNFSDLIRVIKIAKQTTQKPTAIICRTIPGKGVDFMENDYHWHGKAPNLEEKDQALAQL
jgi:transketolase